MDDYSKIKPTAGNFLVEVKSQEGMLIKVEVKRNSDEKLSRYKAGKLLYIGKNSGFSFNKYLVV